MATTAPLMFKPLATMSNAGGSEPTTIQVDQGPISSTTATLTADSIWTSASAPASSPSQLLGTQARSLFSVRVPTDAATSVYLGVDNTLTIATGVQVVPGSRVLVSGYIGPLWTLSGTPGVAASFFYRTA